MADLASRIEFVRGVTYKAAVDLHSGLDDGSVVLLRANNIKNGQLVFDDVQFVDSSKVKQKQLLRKGDILVCASSGSKNLVGKAALVTEDMNVTFGAFCCVLRPRGINAEYLGHYFQSKEYRRAIEESCTGSNINNLKADNFKQLQVPSVSSSDQEEVSRRLNAIAALQSVQQDVMSKLDELVKSRFVEMFVDKGFAVVALGDYCSRINNGMTRRGNDDNGSIVLRLVELQEGFIDYSAVNRIRLTEKEKERFLLAEGDILFARVNGNPNNVGRCASFSDVGESVYHNDHVIRASVDKSSFDSSYLVYFINSVAGREQIDKGLKTSAGQYTINQDGIRSISLPKPPIELQREFATFVNQVDKLKFADLVWPILLQGKTKRADRAIIRKMRTNVDWRWK